MKSDENTLAAIIAGAVIIVGTIVGIGAIIWMSAVTLTWLWLWFVVPLGVTQLSLAHAFGISGIVYYLTYRPITHTVDKEQAFKALIQASVAPFTTLGLGYIYQLFM
jgi:hypothetical protein